MGNGSAMGGRLGAAPAGAPRGSAGHVALAALKAQLSAAAFAIMLLILIVFSHLIWDPSWALARYDALLIAAIAIQAFLLAAGWETWDEAKAIILFHIVGTVMEIFKTWAGAWVYPEPSVMRIEGVPLFTGFMYSAVGSYIARSWRLLDARFEHYPNFAATALLATLIYFNFYTHHYVWDWRYALMAATVILFWRTVMIVSLEGRSLRLPLWPLFIAVGVLIWVAENIATWANVWLYPVQEDGWRLVPLAKIGSWSLLMIVSFVLVSAIHRPDRRLGRRWRGDLARDAAPGPERRR
ncbi:MAG: DUF817 domain-containing protein [Pseudomonadota bacterium]